ncbi:MAG: hypothetical protein KC587_04310 [Nitrospira sp.]|nr:hypothetical protein [Nitrospira sp.]
MSFPTQGQSFSFEITLDSQGTPGEIQVNPTIAAGDFKIFRDGVLDGNLDTLPSVVDASHGVVKVTVSSTETTGVGRVCIQAKDQAGSEWFGNSWTFFLETPRAEPGQGAPPASATTQEKVDYLYATAIGKKTNDASHVKIYAADGTTVLFKLPINESGGTTTAGTAVSGP